jgi:V8-like Glu-specific endopeptidase
MKILALALISFSALAGTYAIYGEDNRRDVYAADSFYKQLALTTAAMIHKDQIQPNGAHATISAKSLGDMYQLCPGERFRQQPIAANCSGTLIAPDVIMTAGHCYDLPQQTCKENLWVFDYKVSKENQSNVTVPQTNLYECEKVIVKEMKDGVDFALIKLKRVVSDRVPAKLKLRGSLSSKDPLVMIGHPRGLPTKVTDGGFVVRDEPTLYYTNLDAFSVNSGSGVFHARTGEVVGILVSGRNDYSSQNGCTISTTYDMAEGSEAVVKVEVLKKFL